MISNSFNLFTIGLSATPTRLDGVELGTSSTGLGLFNDFLPVVKGVPGDDEDNLEANGVLDGVTGDDKDNLERVVEAIGVTDGLDGVSEVVGVKMFDETGTVVRTGLSKKLDLPTVSQSTLTDKYSLNQSLYTTSSL